MLTFISLFYVVYIFVSKCVIPCDLDLLSSPGLSLSSVWSEIKSQTWPSALVTMQVIVVQYRVVYGRVYYSILWYNVLHTVSFGSTVDNMELLTRWPLIDLAMFRLNARTLHGCAATVEFIGARWALDNSQRVNCVHPATSSQLDAGRTALNTSSTM